MVVLSRHYFAGRSLVPILTIIAGWHIVRLGHPVAVVEAASFSVTLLVGDVGMATVDALLNTHLTHRFTWQRDKVVNEIT